MSPLPAETTHTKNSLFLDAYYWDFVNTKIKYGIHLNADQMDLLDEFKQFIKEQSQNYESRVDN